MLLSTLDMLNSLFESVLSLYDEQQRQTVVIIRKFVEGWCGEQKIASDYIEHFGMIVSRISYIIQGTLPRDDNIPELNAEVEIPNELEDQLPDYLKCPVCFGFITLPMLTPSGTSYCKSCIETVTREHCDRAIEPMSKTKLNEFSLYFNRALYCAGRDWLNSNSVSHKLPALSTYPYHTQNETVE